MGDDRVKIQPRHAALRRVGCWNSIEFELLAPPGELTIIFSRLAGGVEDNGNDMR